MMKIVKVDNKWVIKGKGKGWIIDRIFSRKWKAEVALEVFNKGGRVSDYWKAAREYAANRPIRIPYQAIEKLTNALEEIKCLNPTCEEINQYAETVGYGTLTYSNNKNYFPPSLHNTWCVKSGGRVHIDIGCCGNHLMLDKYAAPDFIEFIKKKREVAKPSSNI